MWNGNPLAIFFRRNPGSIEPLDGLRAVAILWVMVLHSGLFWAGYLKCALPGWYFPFLYVTNKGDFGVDIFFVLSGFLNVFILLKECEKYGPVIDKCNFYRGRILRLYPALIVACFYMAIIQSDEAPWW